MCSFYCLMRWRWGKNRSIYPKFPIKNEKEINKGLKKRYLDKVLGYFELCAQREEKNAFYRVFLGSSYGIKISFSGFPALLEWSRRCILALDQAKELDENNPEIRLMRVRSLVHFPYQFYGSLKESILDDAGQVAKWIEQYEKARETKQIRSNKFDAFFRNIKNETSYLLGNYLYSEAKDPAAAKIYLVKVEGQSRYFQLAGEILKRI